MLKELCKRMFGRSLWVYHANSGGCNGCDIEVLNALTPYYDAERFGIRLVGYTPGMALMNPSGATPMIVPDWRASSMGLPTIAGSPPNLFFQSE